jgi:hypothetical protein
MTRIDHVIYGTPDLDWGVAEIETLLGVTASPGGQHPGRGTHNALVALGPGVYLEIIAPDPAQPEPAAPRMFDVEKLTDSKLVAWCAGATDLPRFRDQAVRAGVPLGDVISGGRRRPDGVEFSWQATNPIIVVADGVVPFFIDWGSSPHPSADAAAGATLISLRAEHPDAPRVERMLRQLGLDLIVRGAGRPALIAEIDCPRGRVALR